jgi:biopolymer transport protein ExbD
MNLQPPGGEDEPEIILVSLIDVVFILLLFFIVTTTFKHQSRIQIELPEASADAVQQEEQPLEIIVDAQGRYFIGDQQVINSELKTLKSAISKALGDRESAPVTVRADANTPHQAVITVLDATSQLGLTHISLATTRVSDK